MTEQQIDKLKTVLEASSQKQTTPELDEKILHHAKVRAELQQNIAQSANSRPSQSGPFGNFAIAFSALVCTVAILFGLAEMTSVTEPSFSLNEPTDKSIALIDVAQTTQQAQTPTIVEALKRPAEEASSSIFDEEVIAEIVLPSARQVVDGIQFNISQDRQYAEQVISQALGDINQLLNAGNLATARRRYQQLREGCTSCSLPQTLEALARINTSQMDNG